MPAQLASTTSIWNVLGAGAQGLLWLAYARRAELDWRLLMRTGDATTVAAIYEHAGQRQSFTVPTLDLNQARALRKVLVCVKTYQLDAALSALQPALAEDAVVVLALNGYGWLDLAAERLPQAQLFCLSSTHGSYRPAPMHVVDTGRSGGFHLGVGRSRLDTLALQALTAELQQTGLNVQWSDGIDQLMLRKLAINACINPLTARLSCRNGELSKSEAAQTLLKPLLIEICAALPALGLTLSETELAAAVDAVCAATADNFSSMHEDFWQGRPTEVEAILSPLITAAADLGRAAPVLSYLRDFIRAGPFQSGLAAPVPHQP